MARRKLYNEDAEGARLTVLWCYITGRVAGGKALSNTRVGDGQAGHCQQRTRAS